MISLSGWILANTLDRQTLFPTLQVEFLFKVLKRVALGCIRVINIFVDMCFRASVHVKCKNIYVCVWKRERRIECLLPPLYSRILKCTDCVCERDRDKEVYGRITCESDREHTLYNCQKLFIINFRPYPPPKKCFPSILHRLLLYYLTVFDLDPQRLKSLKFSHNPTIRKYDVVTTLSWRSRPRRRSTGHRPFEEK